MHEKEETGMECSMCGDVGFQISLFQCSKCLIRFQHQYCSRAYFESKSEVCEWCFAIQQEDAASDIKIVIRDSVKRVRRCSGFEDRNTMSHNSKGKKDMRKSSVEIDEKTSVLLKKKERPEIKDSIERKNRKRYKLLDEILC